MSSYMARPTEVLEAYLRRFPVSEPRSWYQFGRLAMALEITTVVKTLEAYETIARQAPEIVSVLQTLLREQGLEREAGTWYDALNAWRAPRFSPVPEDTDASGHLTSRPDAAHASPVGGLQDAVALAEGTRARQDSGQSQDLPSTASAQQLHAEAVTRRSVQLSLLDGRPEDQAAILRSLHIRRETGR